jgi:hypothetical protein
MVFARRYMNAAEELKAQARELAELLEQRDAREKRYREALEQIRRMHSAGVSDEYFIADAALRGEPLTPQQE